MKKPRKKEPPKHKKSPFRKLRVGILGATGTVGQKMILALQDHPWFEITALAASKESAGKTYGNLMVSRWKQESPIPKNISRIKIQEAKPGLECDFVISSMHASVAKPIESAFAKEGYSAISNARVFRTESDTPLVVPEINADHLALIKTQMEKRKWSGFIVTNPNCVAIPLSLSLAPIHAAYGISKIFATTMQAISGAGYPGVSSLDILGNVIPNIGGEEEKVESEPLKIFSKLTQKNTLRAPSMTISSACNRVPVKDGHLITISFKTRRPASLKEIKGVLKSFEAEPQKLKLPTAPKKPLIYHENDFRPQPRIDRDVENGMAISVGRLRECPILDYKMTILGHNTMRGAAGAAILNAELLYKKGYLSPRT